MNYRHIYHAGNFADVVKHVVLTRVLTYLRRKPQPFRVIDTHAGAGLYDLSSVEAAKTGEWQDGIGRVMAAAFEPRVADLLAPYLDAVRAANAGTEALQAYPGSPGIARHLLRDGDRLVVNDLNGDVASALREEFARDRQTTVSAIDGWQAVKALLPPPERRGVVIIDPPFEDQNEFDRLGAALETGLAKFATGIFVVWYPVKDRVRADTFRDRTMAPRDRKCLDIRLAISRPFAGLGLTESGVLVVNPPYVLREEVDLLLPALTNLLAEDDGARSEVMARGD